MQKVTFIVELLRRDRRIPQDHPTADMDRIRDVKTPPPRTPSPRQNPTPKTPEAFRRRAGAAADAHDLLPAGEHDDNDAMKTDDSDDGSSLSESEVASLSEEACRLRLRSVLRKRKREQAVRRRAEQGAAHWRFQYNLLAAEHTDVGRRRGVEETLATAERDMLANTAMQCREQLAESRRRHRKAKRRCLELSSDVARMRGSIEHLQRSLASAHPSAYQPQHLSHSHSHIHPSHHHQIIAGHQQQHQSKHSRHRASGTEMNGGLLALSDAAVRELDAVSQASRVSSSGSSAGSARSPGTVGGSIQFSPPVVYEQPTINALPTTAGTQMGGLVQTHPRDRQGPMYGPPGPHMPPQQQHRYNNAERPYGDSTHRNMPVQPQQPSDYPATASYTLPPIRLATSTPAAADTSNVIKDS